MAPTRVDVITARRHSGVWSGHVVALAVYHDDVPAGCRSVVVTHLAVSARLDSCLPGTGDDVEVRGMVCAMRRRSHLTYFVTGTATVGTQGGKIRHEEGERHHH